MSYFRGLQRGKKWELLLLILFATWAGFTMLGNASLTVGPVAGRVSLTPSLVGTTKVDLGVLGSISYHSHLSPVKVTITLDNISLHDAGRVVKNQNSLDQITRNLGFQFKIAIYKAALKGVIGAIFFSFLVTYLFDRRVKILKIPFTIVLLLSLVLSLFSYLTYNPKAIYEPRYNGMIKVAPSLIGSLKDITQNYSQYRLQLSKLLTTATSLYNLTLNLPSYQVDSNTLAILHISDLHLNPQSWDMIKKIIIQFHIDMIADTGDLTDHGMAFENQYFANVASLKIPYLYVRGNHDSLLTESTLSSAKNVIILDDSKVVKVKGLNFAGIGDPQFTPDKMELIPSKEVLESESAFAGNIAGKGVSVAMIHDPSGANYLSGVVPTILAGHIHQRMVRKLSKGTILFIEGSTGGSGLRTLSSDNYPDPLEASVLYLDKTSGKVIATDEITMGGVGLASVEVDRRLYNSKILSHKSS